MHTVGSTLVADGKQYGLSSNIAYVVSLNGWSYGQVAEQMYPHEPPDGPNRLSARKGLAQVIERKQKRWRRHLPALARAWNLPEFVLLFDDLRRCPTREALEERFGFGAQGRHAT
jgi:hypothetical protein